MRAARPALWRLLRRYRGGAAVHRGSAAALGVLLGTTAATGAPVPRNACVDASICRSATTADAPRQLVLLPTPARLALGADGKLAWTIPVLGWVYAPISSARSECEGTVARLSREALRLLITPPKSAAPSPGPAAALPTASRLTGFFVDNLCNQKVHLRIVNPADPAAVAGPPLPFQPAPDDPFCRTLLLMPDEKPAGRLLPISDHGGLFCGKLTLSEETVRQLSPQGQPLTLQAELVDDRPATPPLPPTRATAEAFLMRDTAAELSIISDIDDTVRISHVADKPALVRGTFFEPFRTTPGLAELYARWQAHSPGLTLHFISSSPLPLYRPLRDELITKSPFPLATYHLKWFRVSEGDTISLIAKSPLLTKKRQIAPLVANYPHRRWALVGDTGERDPEVYTNLLLDKMLPAERVAGIFIRDVTCDAQGLSQLATGLVGAVASVSQKVSRVVRDHLPATDQRTCRQRRFHDAFKTFYDVTKSLPKPVADTAWRKWCVFYGGEAAADLAAVPALDSPDLAALGPDQRPPQCWPHTQAEFLAAIATGTATKVDSSP